MKAVALDYSEDPAGDGRVLWYVKLLQPGVAIPTILGQLLSRLGREL